MGIDKLFNLLIVSKKAIANMLFCIKYTNEENRKKFIIFTNSIIITFMQIVL